MLIVELNNKELLSKTNVDGFIIGINNLSSDTYYKLSIEEAIELINIIHQNHQLAFIDLTGMYHDEDKALLKEAIEFLKDADYFIYHDMILQDLVSSDKLFYYGLTYGTNKYDLAISLEENKYALISPELSLEEIKAIDLDNLFVITFGTWEIFHSRRELLTNYFKYRGWEKISSKYQVVEEFRPGEYYPIIEENGTKIYLNGMYYMAEELENLKHHLIIKTFDLPLNVASKIIDLYALALNNHQYKQLDEELKTLDLPLNKGLLYQKSILTKGEQKDE